LSGPGRAAAWRGLLAVVAAARARLRAGGTVGLEPLARGLEALGESERRPPDGPEERAALLALLDEVGLLAEELAAERGRLRSELLRLERAGAARRGYAAARPG
jgi:hypothetical protein